jgi:adenine-specific DNA-methyltransferase
LADIGLSVSTGRVVEFRSREWLRTDPAPDTVPLIHPAHFNDGWVLWPGSGQKRPNSFRVDQKSSTLLIPAAVHVLTKRFSAKEQKRRIAAALFDPARVRCRQVAFENHVNYFHDNGRGLSLPLAKGLTAFLNSTMVDTYFRQFNGHTQVNAADLRNLKYPTRRELEELGAQIGDDFPVQAELDRLIEKGFSGWRTR